MKARCVMVLGTTSSAGKSWLATALCRWYARQGLKVAPFKAQNMSNNARVVAGGEIGSAQYFQALAAGAEPEVRMNPLLLKPERDTHSQVVLLGQVDEELTARPWRGRSASVWPRIARALDELRAENDVVVIEGAGSPAEINLKDSDIVNMRVAAHADAACLLVTDIDRGGAFAHLYGTWALLDAPERARIRGFVLNKFRGDAALLAPAPQRLEQLTGVPTLATLPMWRQHGLPEEDGWYGARGGAGEGRAIALVAYPRISNLDEFQPLANLPGVRLVWARRPADLAGADWVVLPGSKHTSGDLAWLREQGLDRAILRHAGEGRTVLGVCGGLQMLGEALVDPHGIDGNAPGLGLLPLVTQFEPAKTVRRTSARFGAVGGPWAPLAGVAVAGYEIHHGRTAQHPAMARAQAVLPDGLGWQNAGGNVLGLYLHGMFEDPAVLQALFGAQAPTLDHVFDGLADFIEAHFPAGALPGLITRS
ncbi:cobyric acid synthase [Ramlibacter tataouinensis]|uniref:Cobyric acid synthase n=1 Tax=Ramlibacter tataouinensis (strain ATCC BAA-407 / DSM 14655 / LMG 21543 / TTB310) TaxID=365046 RepID=F5Y651_RAMTT|nr:cobyric acid synthase [Ramlibacter tataouinensis]AEG92737.1 candidate cobyric acid synthase [Ramlibacter tataouinensis TTB310]